MARNRLRLQRTPPDRRIPPGAAPPAVSPAALWQNRAMRAWSLLLLAGLLEIGWAVGLKFTDGFTNLRASIVTVAAMIGSMYLLALAARDLPIGTAYAVWTGIGAMGTAILGMVLFGEPRDLVRFGAIALIVCGVLGLRITSS